MTRQQMYDHLDDCNLCDFCNDFHADPETVLATADPEPVVTERVRHKFGSAEWRKQMGFTAN